jgi:hypothetical protein
MRGKSATFEKQEPATGKEIRPKLAASLASYEQGIQKETAQEYPICPHRLEEMMRDIGFKKRRIAKSALANFAVVIGE